MLDGFDEVIFEGDSDRADGDFDVDRAGDVAGGVLDEIAARRAWRAWSASWGEEWDDRAGVDGDIGGLGDEVVFDVFPHLLGFGGVGALGFFLWSAEAAGDLFDGHADGDLVLFDDGLDGTPPFLAFFEVGEKIFWERLQEFRRHPGDDSALLGVAPDAEEPFVGKRLGLDDLGEPEGACVARLFDVEIRVGWLKHFEAERFDREVGEVDDPGVADDWGCGDDGGEEAEEGKDWSVHNGEHRRTREV